MNLPLIINRNMKANDKRKGHQESQPASLEQFGLGIQVFKIQSTKVIEGNINNQRKMIKNIENPTYSKPVVLATRKVQMLPSLSSEKKAKTGMPQISKDRKSTIEKKKIVAQDYIKETQPKHKVGDKKLGSAQPFLKNNVQIIAKEKEKYHTHYQDSYNQLFGIFEKVQSVIAQNEKEIKRMKRLKQNSNLLERRQDRLKQMIEESAQEGKLEQYQLITEYEQFDISSFVEFGKFKYSQQQNQQDGQ